MVGGRLDGHLNHVAGQAQVTLLGEFLGPVKEGLHRTSQSDHLGSHRGISCRLETRRVAVPPTAPQSVEVPHHELRLVIEGFDPGPADQVVGHSYGVEDLV
ncbi:uncharacterized protein METZ01_LOCUS142991 [marine metagenome]|uniref:Uncharacterized protein n=1 Tax=marine metagenome TaxID=408172 RepID=A0A381ZN25_9ZZZZ